jgi:hypothetical protein
MKTDEHAAMKMPKTMGTAKRSDDLLAEPVGAAA